MTNETGVIFSNILAGISLLFSLYVYFTNKKHIEVIWDPNIEIIKNNRILIGGEISDSVPSWFYLGVTIINPSSHDIGFFNLRAFNPKNNMNLEIVSQKTIPPTALNKKIFQLYMNDRMTELDIPPRLFGTFPANSTTTFDLLFYAYEDIDNQLQEQIRVTFKIADKKLFYQNADPFSSPGYQDYKFFSKTFTISGYQKLLEEKQEEPQLT